MPEKSPVTTRRQAPGHVDPTRLHAYVLPDIPPFTPEHTAAGAAYGIQENTCTLCHKPEIDSIHTTRRDDESHWG
jgi:hypothetical protein